MKTKRALPLILLLSLLISLFPLSAAADADSNGGAAVGGIAYLDLQAAFDALPPDGSGYIRLQQDFQVDQQYVVTAPGTLDLNGYMIYNTRSIYNYGAGSLSLISVQGGGALNIVDSSRGRGAVRAKPNDCYAVDARYGGQLTIRGGSYGGNIIAVYADGGGVEIKDGYFYIQQPGNGSYSETLYRTERYGSSVSTVGGSYYRFNPASKGFVPAGYRSSYDYARDAWTVSRASARDDEYVAACCDADGENWTYHGSFEDAVASVPEGGAVQLLADCGGDAVDNGKSFSISLAGHTLSCADSFPIGENNASHVSIAKGGGRLNGNTITLYNDSTLSISDDDITVDMQTYAYNDNITQYSISGGTYLHPFNKLYLAKGYALVEQSDGTWKVRHAYSDTNHDGLCDVCAAPLPDDINYVPDEGEIIGVALETIGYQWVYRAYVGDGSTNYQEDIHEDYEAAIDYSHVRVDYPVTVDNQTGRKLLSGTVDDGEALSVTLSNNGQSYSTVKPPHPELTGDETINEIKTLMWEGLLTIESDNGYPDAGGGTLSISIVDQSAATCTVSFVTHADFTVEEQRVLIGGKAAQPAHRVDPAADGAWFAGWYADAACTQPFAFDTPITGDTVLHAKWVQPDLVLPDDLTEIGAEAFAGDAFSFAALSENTEVIGRRAFADCPALAYIYIPAATEHIDAQAFGNRRDVTVFGKPGTRAESCAEQYGFAFIAVS